jgi:hypothetical protein
MRGISTRLAGYPGLVGGGLASAVGRGIGRLFGGTGSGVYKSFSPGGGAYKFLTGKATTRRMGQYDLGNLDNLDATLRKFDDELVAKFENSAKGRDLTTSRVERLNSLADQLKTGSPSIHDINSLYTTTYNASSLSALVSTYRGVHKLRKAALKGGGIVRTDEYMQDLMAARKWKIVTGGGLSIATAFIAHRAVQTGFKAAIALQTSAINYVASIGEYEAIQSLPMLNTRQAATERQAALSYIQESRTNARTLLGNEAMMRH